MKKYLPTGVVVVLVIVTAILVYNKWVMSAHVYVRGVYGNRCYPLHMANLNIRYPVYFNNLDDCVKTLKQK